MKTTERHVFIFENREKHTVIDMCRVLQVSESGYYRWLRNRGKETKRQLLSIEIQKIRTEQPENDNYGINRICLALEQKGIITSRRTVYRVMSEHGWLHTRRTPHGTTKSSSEVQESENLLKGNFQSSEPMKKFITDITEVQCSNGKLYVSAIMDCFSGEIVALETRGNMRKELCTATLEQLKNLCNVNLSGSILHSDRGSQYTSGAFREKLQKMGLRQSLSGSGRCFDNARMESFFATLKKEKIYRIAAHRRTREEVKSIVFRYVFVYYNRFRIYTGNPRGLPPARYRQWATEKQTV